MAAGGVAISWDGAGNHTYLQVSLAGGDRPDFTNKNFSMTMWGRINGNKPGTSTSSEGHVFAFLADLVDTGAHVRIRATDADNSFQVSPFTEVCRYMGTDFNQIDVGTTGDNVDTGENWFYGFTWNYITQVLTYYYVIDEGTIASTSTAGGVLLQHTMDTLRLGASTITSSGGNLEARNVKCWNGTLLDSTAMDLERNSEAPVQTSGLVADYRLTSTSDYANAYAGAGAWGALSATTAGTGTITTGTMDPVDIQAGPSGNACTFYGRLIA